jgi:hypothetical protein
MIAISGMALLGIPAQADPWKDESGKGRLKGHRQGETPSWARGKGYWDGHFKHGRQWSPMPHCQPDHYGFPQHHGWTPMAPPIHGDDYFKERWKAQREYEKESYKAWREWQKERVKRFR